jgi:hypothetical protein
MTDVVIVGFGVVGKATADVLKVPYKVHDPQLARKQSGPFQTVIVCTPCYSGQMDCLDAIEQFRPTEVLVRSTVPPSAIEAVANRVPDAWVAHWPEWLTEATANGDAQNPDKVVVGTMDGDGERAAGLLRWLCGDGWPVPGTYVDYRSSTLGKIGVNSP